MVERGRNPLKGYWSLPGGLVEAGERLEAAIVREVFEETGLRVMPQAVGKERRPIFEIFERIMLDKSGHAEYHYVLADYVCKVVSGDLRAGDDVSRAEWVSLKKLDQFKLTEGTLAVILRASKS